MTSEATEFALRSAVNTNSRDLSGTGGGGQLDAIKGAATKLAQTPSMAPSSGSSSSGVTSSAEAIAIAAAVVVLEKAYEHVGVLKSKRLDYDKERAAGFVSFFIPNDQIESDFSREEKVIDSFIKYAKTFPSFEKYLGIHSATLPDGEDGIYYSVMPFYRMSESLGQPLASSRPIDRQRAAINLYFANSFPDALASIDAGFQKESRWYYKPYNFFKSLGQGHNYLNDRRAPRFIMMCLANLLWNLQHPVDVETGFPLSVNDCIKINHDAEIFLNRLLDKTSPPYLHTINKTENEIVRFALKDELYTKTLKSAYVEEQLHGLNIQDVTNSAHHALRIMDTRIWQLIFKRYHAISRKYVPDDRAAGCMADVIGGITKLLQTNTNLINLLPIPDGLGEEAMMNKPPMTTIDVLIIFCHMSEWERNKLIARLEKNSIGTVQLFARELKLLNDKYIEPIHAVSKRELKVHWYSLGSHCRQADKLTAKRLIPFITLLIEDYNPEVDTTDTYNRAKNWENSVSPDTRLFSGIKQTQTINLMAQARTGYYKWELSPFTGGATELDQLPLSDYRMTQVTKLMDSVRELVENYRSFLLKPDFIKFLLKCLEKTKIATTELETILTEAGLRLSSYEGANTESIDGGKVGTVHKDDQGRVVLSRSLIGILSPMTAELNAGLAKFDQAMTNFKHVVGRPQFVDEQHKLLITKVSGIADQFYSLFGEESGLATVVDNNPLVRGASMGLSPAAAIPPLTPVSYVKDETKRALTSLIKECSKALSWESRRGHKGFLLSELLSMVEHRPKFTDKDIMHVVMELTRFTVSPRKNLFFTAEYGHTDSAKILKKAIKNQNINRVLPLASILFNKPDIDIERITDPMIQQRLSSLRDRDHRWEEPSDDMRVEWLAQA